MKKTFLFILLLFPITHLLGMHRLKTITLRKYSPSPKLSKVIRVSAASSSFTRSYCAARDSMGNFLAHAATNEKYASAASLEEDLKQIPEKTIENAIKSPQEKLQEELKRLNSAAFILQKKDALSNETLKGLNTKKSSPKIIENTQTSNTSSNTDYDDRGIVPLPVYVAEQVVIGRIWAEYLKKTPAKDNNSSMDFRNFEDDGD